MSSKINNRNRNRNKNKNSVKLVKNINITNKNQTQLIFKNNDRLKFNGISHRIIGEGGIQSIEFKIEPGNHILVTPGNMNVWNSNLDYEVEWANKNLGGFVTSWMSSNESINKVTNPLLINNRKNTKVENG